MDWTWQPPSTAHTLGTESFPFVIVLSANNKCLDNMTWLLLAPVVTVCDN